ncbi:MAG: hypothetical protein LBO07_01225 [Coriobacteriales bacterium]|jgi:hypothetical protein|nr:hypothetical protein [Coriobacteriales bacterium]
MTFIGMESFTGGSASNKKAYIEGAHLMAIDPFNMALMELDIRLMSLLTDFASSTGCV